MSREGFGREKPALSGARRRLWISREEWRRARRLLITSPFIITLVPSFLIEGDQVYVLAAQGDRAELETLL